MDAVPSFVLHELQSREHGADQEDASTQIVRVSFVGKPGCRVEDGRAFFAVGIRSPVGFGAPQNWFFC